MKQTTSAAMPPCFEKWCQRFDEAFSHKAQKKGFRDYWGKVREKTCPRWLITRSGVEYHQLHHFLTEAPWSDLKINELRLETMNKCSKTKVSRGFSLIIDDSGHRKSGNFTDGVGRQYIGEIGKTDNGIVVVTTHLYDGRKSLPLDIELYQYADSLPTGKQDREARRVEDSIRQTSPEFEKKTELALKLIDRTLKRGYQPGIVLIDAGYGNNTSFLLELEKKQLKYE